MPNSSRMDGLFPLKAENELESFVSDGLMSLWTKLNNGINSVLSTKLIYRGFAAEQYLKQSADLAEFERRSRDLLNGYKRNWY